MAAYSPRPVFFQENSCPVLLVFRESNVFNVYHTSTGWTGEKTSCFLLNTGKPINLTCLPTNKGDEAMEERETREDSVTQIKKQHKKVFRKHTVEL